MKYLYKCKDMVGLRTLRPCLTSNSFGIHLDFDVLSLTTIWDRLILNNCVCLSNEDNFSLSDLFFT